MAHKQKLRSFHLFAGAGGGILADILLGHEVIGACEIEKYPRDVLLARQRDGLLPEFPIWDDVATLRGEPWRGSVDVLCGGFPCQDISAAGKGAGITGQRSGLWKEYARLIGEMRPRFVFAENSPLLRTRGLGVVLEDLASLGYNARWGVLGARDVGAPHKRDRMWVLAHTSSVRIQEHELRDSNIPSGSSDAAQGADLAYAAEQRHSRPKANGDCSREWVLETIFPNNWGMLRGETDGRCELYGKKHWHTDPAEVNAAQPILGRVAHGVANRVHRLKAVGNGQVPQCAALAFNILSEGLM